MYARSYQLFLQRNFLQTNAFPDQPFYPVSVNRTFELTGADTRAELERAFAFFCNQVMYTETGHDKFFPLTKQLFRLLAAFQSFLFPKGKLP